jgi:hypothetical protein
MAVASSLRRRKLAPVQMADPTTWRAPNGWREVAPHIFEPAGYQRKPWELAPPTDLSTTDAMSREYVKCKNSVLYFATRYCWTLHVDDPSGGGYRRVPAFPYVREFLQWMQTPENTHVEKSRQMMLSWLMMVVFLHDILFQDHWSNLAISKKQKLVDDGGQNSTPNGSLFGKIRVMHERLPAFLFHKFEIVNLRITNLDRESTVKGEAGHSDAGRSGTFNRLLIDESGFVPNGESIFKAARQAAKRGLVLLSTPNGKANVHARIKFTPHTTFKKFSFWWPAHPDKARGLHCECGWNASETGNLLAQFNAHACTQAKARRALSPWYEHECLDLRPDQIGSELDLSYETSVRGRVYDAFRSTLTDVGGHVVDHTTLRQRLTHDHWSAPLGEQRDDESLAEYQRRYLRHALDPQLPTFIAWDFGVSDPTACLLGQEISPDGPIVRWLDSYMNTNQGWKHFHEYIDGLWYAAWRDVGGIQPIVHYGDPYGKNRDSELKSWISNLASAEPPMIVKFKEKGVGGSLAEWLDFINGQYRQNHVQISNFDSLLIDATSQYHYPIDDETGEPLPGKHDPVHDVWSHPCDAKRYLYKFRYGYKLHHDSDNINVLREAMLNAGRGLSTVPRQEW